MEKKERYKNLVEKVQLDYSMHDQTSSNDRTQLQWCKDCKEINLWTYWQGKNRYGAKIMLVGQDWGSPRDKSSQNTMTQIRRANDGLSYNYLHDNPSRTDKNLIELFEVLGYHHIERPNEDLFFTNFILGYRNKGASGGCRREWILHDVAYFRELCNIIEPKVILCLGRATLEGVLLSLDANKKYKIGAYNRFIESERNPVSVRLENGNNTYVFALAHCGVLGTFNRNRGYNIQNDVLQIQKNDWKRIIPYIK